MEERRHDQERGRTGCGDRCLMRSCEPAPPQGAPVAATRGVTSMRRQAAGVGDRSRRPRACVSTTDVGGGVSRSSGSAGTHSAGTVSRALRSPRIVTAGKLAGTSRQRWSITSPRTVVTSRCSGTRRTARHSAGPVTAARRVKNSARGGSSTGGGCESYSPASVTTPVALRARDREICEGGSDGQD